MWGSHVFLTHDVIRQLSAILVGGERRPRMYMVQVRMGVDGITFRETHSTKVTKTLTWKRLYRLATRKEKISARPNSKKKDIRDDRHSKLHTRAHRPGRAR